LTESSTPRVGFSLLLFEPKAEAAPIVTPGPTDVALPASLRKHAALWADVESQALLSVATDDIIWPRAHLMRESLELDFVLLATAADIEAFELCCAQAFSYEYDAAICRLHPHAPATTYARFVARTTSAAHAAAGTYVGTVSALRVGDGLVLINEVAVVPAFRRMGVATRLTAHAMRHAVEHWAPRRLLLTARVEAGDLYAKLGFCPDAGVLWHARHDRPTEHEAK